MGVDREAADDHVSHARVVQCPEQRLRVQHLRHGLRWCSNASAKRRANSVCDTASSRFRVTPRAASRRTRARCAFSSRSISSRVHVAWLRLGGHGHDRTSRVRAAREQAVELVHRRWGGGQRGSAEHLDVVADPVGGVRLGAEDRAGRRARSRQRERAGDAEQGAERIEQAAGDARRVERAALQPLQVAGGAIGVGAVEREALDQARRELRDGEPGASPKGGDGLERRGPRSARSGSATRVSSS